MSLKETVRDWLRQSFAWDFSEKQRIQRAAMATGLGMNPEQYARPFPGSNTTVTNYHQSGGNGTKILTTLALLTAGLGGGWLIGNSLRPETAVAPVTASEELEAVYEEQQPDGSWKEVKRESLKPGP